MHILHKGFPRHHDGLGEHFKKYFNGTFFLILFVKILHNDRKNMVVGSIYLSIYISINIRMNIKPKIFYELILTFY